MQLETLYGNITTGNLPAPNRKSGKGGGEIWENSNQEIRQLAAGASVRLRLLRPHPPTPDSMNILTCCVCVFFPYLLSTL